MSALVSRDIFTVSDSIVRLCEIKTFEHHRWEYLNVRGYLFSFFFFVFLMYKSRLMASNI